MSAARKPRDIRVLVVDDSPFMRKAIERIVSSAEDMVVVGAAATGEEAVEKVGALKPDVVTLDVVMPGIDGIETLKRIMSTHPVPVIMVSSMTQEGAETTIRALEEGALDFVGKPSVLTHMDVGSIAGDLLGKIRVLRSVDKKRLVRERPFSTIARATDEMPVSEHAAVVLIGSSTGGPPALSRVLATMPANLAVPIVICQHMPVGFTRAMAERLNSACPFEVREASDGDLIKPGRVLLGRSGFQMHLERKGEWVSVRLDKNPPDTPHMPSIDVMMKSAAEVYGEDCLAVLLTGMGSDGAAGMLAIRQAGGHTIAEAESSAVVFGMPRAAIEIGGAVEQVDLADMASAILEHVAHKSDLKHSHEPRLEP